MKRHIIEALRELNANPELAPQYKDNNALRVLLDYAFDPAKKMLLPEGDAPFTPDAAPFNMSPANLQQEVRRLYVFCRADLAPARRELLWIQLLEGVHPSEAELLNAVKDQNLTKLFPKVTHELCFNAGLVAVEPTKKGAAKKSVAPTKSVEEGKKE